MKASFLDLRKRPGDLIRALDRNEKIASAPAVPTMIAFRSKLPSNRQAAVSQSIFRFSVAVNEPRTSVRAAYTNLQNAARNFFTCSLAPAAQDFRTSGQRV